MRTKQFIILFAFLLMGLSLKAQEYSIKGQINTNIYANTDIPYTWMAYYVDASYGIAKQIDLGVSFGTTFVEHYNNYIFGLDARYYLTPFIIKKPTNIDLYFKATVGYGMSIRKSTNYTSTGYHYGLHAGIRYIPLKRLGLMLELGFINRFDFAVNAGVSFRIKK